MEISFNIRKTFLITMIVALSISALIGIFILLFGNLSSIAGKILLTTLTVGGYSLTGLCCAALYEKEKARPLAMSGIIVALIGFIYTVLLTWDVLEFSENDKLFFILLILSTSLAHISLLFLIQSNKPVVLGSLFTTIIFITLVAIMLILMVLEIGEGEIYYRILGAFAILDALGTIVTPILNKVYSD